MIEPLATLDAEHLLAVQLDEETVTLVLSSHQTLPLSRRRE